MFEFCQIVIHSIFDSILLYPRFNSKYYSIPKNSADSIQKITQLNSQGIIDTGRAGKVLKNWPKSVQNRQKKGEFSSKMANIDSKYDSLIHFTIKFNSMECSILFVFRNIQFKKFFNNLLFRKIQFKNFNLLWFNSINYSFN